MLCHDSPHCTSHNQVYFMKSRESAWWTIVCDNCVLCKKWLSNIRSPLPCIYIFTSRLGAWSCGKPCVNVQLVGTSCEFLYRATLASPVRLRSYTITWPYHLWSLVFSGGFTRWLLCHGGVPLRCPLGLQRGGPGRGQSGEPRIRRSGPTPGNCQVWPVIHNSFSGW